MALQQSPQEHERKLNCTLQDALASFSSSLTPKEKQKYQTTSTTPDVASVIEFVAQIDANNKNNRRCVAPRLCTFLESIQQFSGVVDTFINSNPEISSLVWGSAKTAILAATNIASYFEKVTSIIMSVGEMCPTYQAFDQLYPGCVGLQSALSEFCATIPSVLMPFESEFKAFVDKLDQGMKEIYLQILLASEKADHETRNQLQYEQRENANFRPLAISTFKRTMKHQNEADQWRIDQQARKTAKLKSNIRSNLSTINHVASWRQAIQPRVSNTAEWIQKDPAFSEWKESPGSAILWYSGTMGMGKTVLISSVIASFHANRERENVIAYHFCRGGSEISLSAKSIMGSLARQIIDGQVDSSAYKDLIKLNDVTKDINRADMDATEVAKFILSRLEADKKYYIIVDGLDECDSDVIRSVEQCIGHLCSKFPQNLKILYSSWPKVGDLTFNATVSHFWILVNEENVKSDIQHYITATLDRCLPEGKLRLGNPTLILDVTKALIDGSNGMFLWASLLIQELCLLTTDDEILEALKHLPRSLSEVFDRKIDRVRERPGRSQAISLLQFCGVTKRPLSIAEFQEALSLHPDQKALDPTKFPTDMNQVIKNCCGLAFVDEEDDTVHLIHHIVKQHLFTRPDHGRDPPHFDLSEVHLNIGSLCMAYLDFTVFKSQLIKAGLDKGSLVSPLLLGTSSVYRSSKTTNQMALRILVLYRKQLQHLGAQDITRVAQEILRQNDPSRDKVNSHDFQFLDYAKTYWINHVADLDADVNTKVWRVFCRLIEQDFSPALKPWESDDFLQDDWKLKEGPKALIWSILEGHFSTLLYHARHHPHLLTEMIKRLVIQAAVTHDDTRFIQVALELEWSWRFLTLMNEGLLWSAAKGRIRILKALLQAGADINADFEDKTPLQAAVEGDHYEMVNFILTKTGDVNARPGEAGQTPLQAAAARGYHDIFVALLAADASANSPPAKISGRTALQAAAEGRHLVLLRALIAVKADVNAPAAPSGGHTVLQAAVRRGHIEIVDTLLAMGADVNAPASSDGLTALQAAAAGGHFTVLQTLLSKGASFNAPASRSGRTALQAAAESGHIDIVKTLLAIKADVNAPPASYGGRTALQGAAENGHSDILRVLLAGKSDVNAPAASHGGRTALQAASGGGYLSIVEELIAVNADVTANCAVNNGRTGLQAATEGGHFEVVKVLLREGAQIDEPPSLENGRTALQAAAEQGYVEIMREFLTSLGYDLTRLAHSNGRLRKSNFVTALPVINAPASSRNGRTALQAAAQNGHIEVVRMLIAVNSLSNAPPAPYGGRTALQAAAEGGHLEIVKILLADGHDVNGLPAPYSGRTALQVAAERGHVAIVEVLLKAKADVEAPASTHDGITALRAANRGSSTRIQLLLEEAKVRAGGKRDGLFRGLSK
ncbi:hypothetical protein N7493_007637 [Penicillium malachiteum]|uniref:NACHT domain-containing protein n=1 Tax=Penicillium malachiteum TaxID=1324776 RepID=A0AAD6HI07_9EURO|nr:hypothetical protein N7493_007637 [Penicillium malachiteum]